MEYSDRICFQTVRTMNEIAPATEVKALTAYSMLVQLATAHYQFWSTEKPCLPASKSEMRRWIKNGSLMINGYVDRDPDEPIDYPVLSIIIHPKSTKRRTTLR